MAQSQAEVKGQEFVKVYVNSFTEASAKVFFDEFQKAISNEQKIVPVFIDSYGGAVDSLAVMIDVILSFPGRVATIGIGKACSCGAILLACGNQEMRYAAPNSRILVHQISAMSYGNQAEIENYNNELKRLNTLVFKLMAKRCNQPQDYFLKLIKEKGNLDIWMTPNEAKGHKIIDHIKNPIVKAEVYTKITIK